ncbi:hypothetical protein BC332_32821 [Capsicum chinense]|nr:hypothetical protein BC332_32821 [Capsicum chinense]
MALWLTSILLVRREILSPFRRMPHLALVNECDIYLFAQHVTVYPENGSCMSSPAPGSWWNPLNALVKHGITAEKRSRERVDVIGDSLGFYGAWPAFALTHHLVIWFVAAQVYLGVPFTRYAILGDDIVIGDERVAERYRELIPPLNVPFSLEKSLVSSVGALEFAKRFFVRGVTKDFFPVSCHMLRSLVSSISLVPVMRAIMSKNLPLSYRLQEAGYRVYTRSTAPPI